MTIAIAYLRQGEKMDYELLSLLRLSLSRRFLSANLLSDALELIFWIKKYKLLSNEMQVFL